MFFAVRYSWRDKMTKNNKKLLYGIGRENKSQITATPSMQANLEDEN